MMMLTSFSSLVLFFLLLLAGCAPTSTTPVEKPPEPLSYNFKFTPPGPVAKKTGITIGVVGVDWGKEGIVYDVGFSPETPPSKIPVGGGKVSKGPLPGDIIMMLKDFDKAIKSEYEAMMIHRGFNTMGFNKIEDMTYPQKTACNLCLKPEFTLTILTQNVSAVIESMTGKAILSSEIVLNVVEPMSNEKLFSKRLQLKSEPFDYTIKYKVANLYDKATAKHVAYERENITWDNRAPALATALTKFFNEIMENSWKYFSPEEMAVLKKHSDEIREKKRF